MGDGRILEGKSTEIGGLMGQDKDGKIKHSRNGNTNKPDGGIDYIRENSSGESYKGYNGKLKKERK